MKPQERDVRTRDTKLVGKGEKATWNYRVVRRHAASPRKVSWLEITEVYYHDDQPRSYAVEMQAPKAGAWGEPDADSISELRTDLERMLAALDKPILDQTDFPGDGD